MNELESLTSRLKTGFDLNLKTIHRQNGKENRKALYHYHRIVPRMYFKLLTKRYPVAGYDNMNG
jgi:hypothetical protein